MRLTLRRQILALTLAVGLLVLPLDLAALQRQGMPSLRPAALCARGRAGLVNPSDPRGPMSRSRSPATPAKSSSC